MFVIPIRLIVSRVAATSLSKLFRKEYDTMPGVFFKVFPDDWLNALIVEIASNKMIEIDFMCKLVSGCYF